MDERNLLQGRARSHWEQWVKVFFPVSRIKALLKDILNLRVMGILDVFQGDFKSIMD